MANILLKLQKLLGVKRVSEAETAVSADSGPLIMNDTAIKKLMRQVEDTQEDQYSCEETSALLDEYVEMVISEEDATALMPLVERHIHFCPDCSARFEVLLTILKTEQE